MYVIAMTIRFDVALELIRSLLGAMCYLEINFSTGGIGGTAYLFHSLITITLFYMCPQLKPHLRALKSGHAFDVYLYTF